MRKIYPSTAQKLFEAGFNWASDNFTAVLLSSAYVFDSTDVFRSDIAAGVLASVAISGKTNTSGVLDASDLTFTGVTGTVAALLIFKDTGVQATSPLCVYDNSIIGVPTTFANQEVTLAWGPMVLTVQQDLTD